MLFSRTTLCLLLLIAPPAMADTVRVLGGEHADFTRLVLHLPGDLRWSKKTAGNSVSLDFSSQKTAFDVSKAFERIRRDRVSSLVAASGVLRIGLGCQCEVSVYPTGQQMLVVDVRSTPERQATSPSKPSIVGSIKRSAINPQTQAKPQEVTKRVKTEVASPPHPQVQATERKLLEQLSRATNLGLLKLSPAPMFENTNRQTPHLAKKARPDVRSNISTNIPIHSAIHAVEATPDVSYNGIECISDTNLTIADWQVGESFSKGLSKLRKELGGEITPINQNSALRMVRHYISYGFGTEAIALLQEMEKPKDGALLAAMAMTIDQLEGPSPMDWRGLATCEGKIALWALVSGEGYNGLNAKSIALNFTSLPEDLQNLLGPRIAEKLLKLDAKEEADFILGNVARQQVQETAEYRFANAKSYLHEGSTVKAASEFSATVQSEAPISAEALIQLILTELEEKRPVSDETLGLLVSYTYQYQDEEIAIRLNQTLYSVRLAAGHFAEAWAMLDASNFSQEGLKQAATTFLKALVENAPDFEFMRYGTTLADSGDEFPPRLSLAVARRFLNLGFTELASRYLKRATSPTEQRSRRLLQAEILLATGNHLAAKAELLGLRGEDVNHLLAQIRATEQPDVQTSDNTEPARPTQVRTSLAHGHQAVHKSRELRSRLEEILTQTMTDY